MFSRLFTCLLIELAVSFDPLTIGVISEHKLETSKIQAFLSTQFTDEFSILYTSVDSGRPYDAIKQACSLYRKGVTVLISETNCYNTMALSNLAETLNLPLITLQSVNRCMLGETNSFTFSLKPSYAMINKKLSEESVKNNWKNYVIFYDNTISYDFVDAVDFQLRKTALANQRDISSKIFLVYNSIGDRDASNLLSEIQSKDKYTTFIIFASEENSLRLLQTAEKIGLSGNNFLWILLNVDVNIQNFYALQNRTRLVAFVRKLKQSAWNLNRHVKKEFDPTFNPYIEYVQDASFLAIKALTSVKTITNFGQVKNLECITPNNQFFQGGENIAKMLRNKELAFNGSSGYIIFDYQNPSKLEINAWIEIEILKFQREHAKSQAYFHKKGQWNATTSWTNLSDDKNVFGHQAQSLKGQTLNVVTVGEEPFIIQKTDVNTGKIVFEGYCIEIFEAIRKSLAEQNEEFDYEIYRVHDDGYGVYDEETKKWTGLVGDILMGKADIAVAGMIRNLARERVVDFTASYMDYGVGILIHKPEPSTNSFGFLEPLKVNVWTYIGLASFATGISIFILSRISHIGTTRNENESEDPWFSIQNSMWWVIGSLMQQGSDYNPRTMSVRILSGIWWYFSLIVVATYTANLAAFLTVTRMQSPIESLYDLSNQEKIPYGTVELSSLEAFFKEQANSYPIYERMWNFMSSKPSPMVRNIEEGYERVLKKNYAFMWDYPVLQYQKKKNCKLMTVGKPFNRKNYAFAVQKGWAHRSKFTMALLKLQEMGSLEEIRKKWFEGESLCETEADSGDAAGLEFHNIAGIFWILFYGISLATFVASIEYIWYKYLKGDKTSCDLAKKSKKTYVSSNSECSLSYKA